jgi:3-oxoacyl-[acyl-carrier protein] reductase
MKYVATIEPDVFRQQMLDDAVGYFNVVRPALPQLRATEGNIVAVTTVATVRFPARDSLSSAPKGAVEGLVRAVAFEEGRFGVRAQQRGSRHHG